MTKTLHLENDIAQVPLLAEWVEMLGEELMLPMPAVFQLNLALEEAVVNVMNYAYPDESGMPVELEAKTDESSDTICFVLSDEGIAFDPTQQDDPDITLSAEERNIGGLGIFLVQQMMQSVAYERSGGKNILTMIYKVER